MVRFVKVSNSIDSYCVIRQGSCQSKCVFFQYSMLDYVIMNHTYLLHLRLQFQ